MPKRKNLQTTYPISKRRRAPTTIYSQPKDTLKHIFSFLSLKDLNAVSQVSKQWKEISEMIYQEKSIEASFLPKPKQSFKFFHHSSEKIFQKMIDNLLILYLQTKDNQDTFDITSCLSLHSADLPLIGTQAYLEIANFILGGQPPLSVVKYIHSTNEKLLQKQGSFGQNFLHHFANTDYETIDYLINTVGLDINEQEQAYGFIPLTWYIYATPAVELNTIKLFINHETNTNEIFELSVLNDEKDCLPLYSLFIDFKELSTDTQKQEHYDILALLAKHCSGNWIDSIKLVGYPDHVIEEVQQRLSELTTSYSVL